jgi:hypothetical protein
MPRKVIQIAADSGRLIVLCDDGEVFRLTGKTWHRVAPIPQGSPDVTAAETRMAHNDDAPRLGGDFDHL